MNTQTQIEFDKIKNMWAELTSTDYAKEKIREADIILNERELRKELQDTTDSRKLIEKLGNPPVQNVTEIREILTIADTGSSLTPYQLERVEKVLVAVERMMDYLSRGKQYENSLAYYDENLNPLYELKDEICRQIRNEEVDDRATKELYEIRNRITTMEESMKQKAEQIIRKNKAYMADSYYTMRNGRVCVPVKKECKAKIPGIVIDKSATGNTLFVEPVGLSKCYEELELLRIDEENEVYKILYILTAMVSDVAPIMEENIKMMEKLDYVFSKGKLSIDLDCIKPAINLERRIKLAKARHPLMDKEVNVPLDFSLEDEGVNGIVITGPNTGGKTVAIKTVMLSCYMAQCGLHVPCKAADICMNSNYLSDIGDGQNLSENLSTFSAHIKNVLDILGSVNQESLVIMDELGSGTDPAEGMGIAVAILEELRKSGANFLVTTHYPEIKEYASRAEHIVNARMVFDKETLRPTYEMIIGEAGESCAFYIAERLGMPEEMLKVAAKAAYGKDYEFSGKKNAIRKRGTGKIVKAKKIHSTAELEQKFSIGDSVMIYPDKKIGIVCEPINKKGILRVQLPNKKIYINHKRVKLHVKADELYPEDYDFSIIFDTVANRKARHEMSRKLTDKVIVYDENS
ncbi:DNA mismatch repair protein MutS [Butyrivibrio sp. INlla16]|uniref:endonuclease MutS2 n=1 Tax=Butyrivibrio sp. INlla16 TaxID=1520807 RepID=UPI00088EB97A|nr:DNA mismatch repair protein MutS [Butyrivibrio sp. INlla16]SDB11397.1 dsDNA-specific endonuclease/ATPase MutS2 [Butyrivibrio sp. INlla16]